MNKFVRERGISTLPSTTWLPGRRKPSWRVAATNGLMNLIEAWKHTVSARDTEHIILFTYSCCLSLFCSSYITLALEYPRTQPTTNNWLSREQLVILVRIEKFRARELEDFQVRLFDEDLLPLSLSILLLLSSGWVKGIEEGKNYFLGV